MSEYVFLLLAYTSTKLEIRVRTPEERIQINTTQTEDQRHKEKPQVQAEKTLATEDEMDSYEKGLEFEKYIVSRFNKEFFTHLDWSGDKNANGQVAQSAGNPDMLLEINVRDGSAQFAVECKWRAHYYYDQIEIAKESSIRNYKLYAKSKGVPVFIVLGVGGKPSKPNEVFSVPLSDITDVDLHRDWLKEYKHDLKREGFFYNLKAQTLE